MGNVLNLRHLASICDPRRDFYGIQARGLTGEAPPHRSLVEAGRTYWEEVRRIQPRGPYYIGGFCIGGVAALEMARLIQAEGEEVGLLAMLDSHLPELRGTLDLKDRAQIQFERLRDERIDYVREWARGKVEYKLQQLRRRLGVYDDDPGDPTQYRSQLVNDAIMYARSVYEPSYYDGDIVVFRPPLAPRHHLTGGRIIDRNRGFLKADNGWTGMVRSLRICELACPPGEHDGFVLEPFVRDLARRMREFLPAD
jgi:thioesterase domain-containing protein